jgi:hypothetical protein
MAIEEADMRDREVWSNVARAWYNKAADRSPNTGRIQHHLAVLARPNIVQQLFYYSKSLVSVQPFENARESILLLFNPLLDTADPSHYDKYPVVEASLVTAFAALFKRTSIQDYQSQVHHFTQGLSKHITLFGSKWKTQGPETAAALFAGCLDFGNDENPLWSFFKQHMESVQSRRTSPVETTEQSQVDVEDAETRDVLFADFWTNLDAEAVAIPRAPFLESNPELTSETVTLLVLDAFRKTTTTNANQLGDRNIVPYMYFVLSFVWALARVGRPLIYLEAHIPWSSLMLFLNTLGRSGVSEEKIQSPSFPESVSGTGRQLPEDFPARGAVWAQHLYPPDFFRRNVTDEDERTLELPSHTAPRCERCLWLGVRLASLGRYLVYDPASGQFSVTEYASSLERRIQPEVFAAENHTLAEKPRPPTERQVDPLAHRARSTAGDSDYVMIDRESMNPSGGDARDLRLRPP